MQRSVATIRRARSPDTRSHPPGQSRGCPRARARAEAPEGIPEEEATPPPPPACSGRFQGSACWLDQELALRNSTGGPGFALGSGGLATVPPVTGPERVLALNPVSAGSQRVHQSPRTGARPSNHTAVADSIRTRGLKARSPGPPWRHVGHFYSSRVALRYGRCGGRPEGSPAAPKSGEPRCPHTTLYTATCLSQLSYARPRGWLWGSLPLASQRVRKTSF